MSAVAAAQELQALAFRHRRLRAAVATSLGTLAGIRWVLRDGRRQSACDFSDEEVARMVDHLADVLDGAASAADEP